MGTTSSLARGNGIATVEMAEYAGGREVALPDERARLVRLCACITGDWDAAEDLAQETLVEAWRQAHKLYGPEGRARWLAAIARNVCLRWGRRQGRELARRAYPASDDAGAGYDDWPADAVDVETELERDELARLLDRALALLPPVTRRVLIESYVEESPQAEVAARLGLSEGAVAMRLQRGKLALRRTLTTDPRAEASAYGIASPTGEWQQTRIWCPKCGQHRLKGIFTLHTPRKPLFALRCPGCCVEPEAFVSRSEGSLVLSLLTDLKGFKPALSRVEAYANAFYRRQIVDPNAACVSCGRPVPVLLYLPDHALIPPSQHGGRGVFIECQACGTLSWTSVSGLALCLPEGQRFWRAHPRLRTLPEREVEADGQPALVTAFESVTDGARLDVVLACDTYQVLGIHGAPHERGRNGA